MQGGASLDHWSLRTAVGLPVTLYECTRDEEEALGQKPFGSCTVVRGVVDAVANFIVRNVAGAGAG